MKFAKNSVFCSTPAPAFGKKKPAGKGGRKIIMKKKENSENKKVFTDVVFASLISVVGSVITFILAGIFSNNRIKAEQNFAWTRHLMKKRLSFYEDTLSQLAPEKLPLVQVENFSPETLYHLFADYISRIGIIVSLARLYADRDVITCLESLQDLVRGVTARIAGRKDGADFERLFSPFVDDFRIGYDRLVFAVRTESGADSLKPFINNVSEKQSHKRRGNKSRNGDGKI